MSENVWQFGDWGRTKNGTIVRFVSVWDGGEIFTGETGTVNCLRDVEYLPDCTGWDWKPIEPPPGYRILGRKEEVVPGDKYKADCHATWFDATVFGDTVERLKAASTVAYARKIEPQYRPFANAEEFRPHRDRWWRYKDDRGRTHTPQSYSAISHGGKSWKDRFEQCEFDNGEPFGVEDK